MKKSIQELKEEFKKLPKTYESEKNEKNTPSDAVWESNVYLTPRNIATYWRPALSGAEAKVLDYLVYKIFGFSKDLSQTQEENKDGDYISLSQMLYGTTTKKENGDTIRWDWGAGVTKSVLINSLNLLELLNLIEIKRKKEGKSKETNLYKLSVLREYETKTKTQRKLMMEENPKNTVNQARNFLKDKGIWIG